MDLVTERPAQPPRTAPVSSLVSTVAAVTSAGAAVIHLGTVVDHLHHPVMAVGFLAMAVVQLLVALKLRARGGRRWIKAAIVANAAIVAVWVASRTIGLAFVPGIDGAEGVGLPDLIATGLEIVTIALAAALLRRPRAPAAAVEATAAWRLTAAVAAVVVWLAAAAVLSPDAHEHDHDPAPVEFRRARGADVGGGHHDHGQIQPR